MARLLAVARDLHKRPNIGIHINKQMDAREYGKGALQIIEIAKGKTSGRR